MVKGVFVRFGFDAIRISQIQRQVKNKATKNVSWGVLYTALMAPIVSSVVAARVFYILTLAWGFRRCISVVHSKMIFLICYLLDYQ